MKNWSSLVNGLRKRMTLVEIADEVGVHTNTISELSAGRTQQPLYETGVRLLALRKNQNSLRRRDRA